MMLHVVTVSGEKQLSTFIQVFFFITFLNYGTLNISIYSSAAEFKACTLRTLQSNQYDVLTLHYMVEACIMLEFLVSTKEILFP